MRAREFVVPRPSDGESVFLLKSRYLAKFIPGGGLGITMDGRWIEI
jgi:hypothetical protein